MDRAEKLTSTRVENGRRQIFITAGAERIIASLQPRLVDVVAVVGPMRKGKSYLANRLCNRKSGFPLGDDMESKTKGFWFWIGPHPVQDNRYLMVVDTEGLGDYSDEEQRDKDTKYLVLATLLSNQLVFNLQGNPDSAFAANLRLMGDLSERIRVQADVGDDGNSLGDHSPELWVAVQNAHLNLPKRNGRRLTPDEFLNDVLLEHKNGKTKAIKSHNAMTTAVKAFFPKRHLRLIPTPSGEPDVLNNLDKAGDNVLQPQYKHAVGSFICEIWNSGQVKRINGDAMKTTGLLDIMRYYVNAINNPNSIPSVLDAYEAMAEGECRRALNEQMKQFQKTVEETVEPLMPMDEETCNSKIKTAVENAVTKLTADVGKWDQNGTWKNCLQVKLETERRNLLTVNGSKRSKALCDKIMKEADQTVGQKVESGDYSRIGGFDTYTRDMKVVYSTYRQRASGNGPAVEEALETFRAMETTRRNTIYDTVRKLEEEDRRVKEEQRKRQEEKEAAERAAERAAARERLARAEAARAEAERAAAEAKRRAAQEEAARAAEAQRRAEAERAAEEARRRAAEEREARAAERQERAEREREAAIEAALMRRQQQNEIGVGEVLLLASMHFLGSLFRD